MDHDFQSAPGAEATISYSMTAFRLDGKILVYFATHKNHIGFYPTSSPIEASSKELTPYRHAKGSIQFPFCKPVPFDLIKKMVSFRAKEIDHKRAYRTSQYC